MKKIITQKETGEVSRAIVLYKLVTGITELILGLGILIFGRQVGVIYRNFRAQELLEDRHDILISVTQKIVPLVIRHREYIIFFLIIFGVAKIIGAVGLLYDKEWGLDLLIGIFFIFLPFDVYSLIVGPSFLKFIYLLANAFVAFYLIEFKPHKYFRRLKKYLPNR